ncbi:MAG: hydantoinase/oxoprolinase family protein [Verrucomicrobia bacterium]|nr:hydantoinase/oxoprolinase family protein [Verrucomicrobiota bacterium]
MQDDRWRLGIDTGGTFTDVVAVNSASGDLVHHKVHSTPGRPADAVVNGVMEIAQRGHFGVEDISLLVHGSTVATNTVLTRTGARVAMITTAGFRDILQIRRQNRPELYNLRARRPDGLVPRSRILEIPERSLHDGSILIPLEDAELDRIEGELHAMEVDAIVVGLLNSYVNPSHEQILGERLRSAFPAISVCLSHEIACSQGEFERFSTAVLNGYVQPAVTGYLGQLEALLTDCNVHAPLFVMKSNGGVAAAVVAAQRSVELLLSGPAGGAVAGAALARQHTCSNVITADMGGTSFDVAVIHDGAGVFTQERTFSDQTIQLPMMDIETIGAGGGSIAWVDAGGAMRVGPRSAGAEPGPACYGRGGHEPTVTDANLVLGRLAPHSSMAGGIELDIAAARDAIDSIATPLRLSLEATAEGMLNVVNANMTVAIRKLTVERGHDPADFVLCPCGGAGPLHGSGLAREMGIGEVVIPVMPGVFSAYGLLLSELREENLHSQLGLLTELLDELPAVFERLLLEPRRRLALAGMTTDRVARRLRLRYFGQGHDLTVTLSDSLLDRAAIEDAFHAAHRDAYGYDFPGDAIEVVAAWVSATVELQDTALPAWPGTSKPQPVGTRPVIFDAVEHDTPVYNRATLGTGSAIDGPAIIEQPDTTVVIEPGQNLVVDRLGQILIDTRGTHGN